ncbi:MAG: methylated-DNA--[Bacteroidales bacterium]|nr:methylated-DNA--[protein]-cysteine S-methyltransferase [Bacteroidales bacterium]
MDYTWHYDSPLGGITMASDGKALTGLWFDGQKFFAETLLPEHQECLLPVFEETCRWLDLYFSGVVPDFTPALSLRCSPFRKRVCEIMLTIPYGQTMTYGEIAATIAEERGLPSMSAQAVGGAVGHNPISLIIPCHRVLGSGRSLSGSGSALRGHGRALHGSDGSLSGYGSPLAGSGGSLSCYGRLPSGTGGSLRDHGRALHGSDGSLSGYRGPLTGSGGSLSGYRGALIGYAGGLDRKARLLRLESGR